MAVFIVELFFYTWCRVQNVNLGYAINQENARSRELVTLQNNLKIELERLKSPERISRIAEKHIGLVKPSPEQMVIIR
jgi:cell division protein FtsL